MKTVFLLVRLALAGLLAGAGELAPEGWRRATPPLNPIMGCINMQMTTATPPN